MTRNRLKRMSPHYWASKDNQRRFLERLAHKYKVRTLDDWYRVPSSDFPAALLARYGNFHYRILQHHYPRHAWCEWRFIRTPSLFWTDRKNRRRYFEWLGAQLGFHSSDDWYRVTGDDIRSNYGAAMLASYYKGSYIRALLDVFDEVQWQPWRFRTIPDGFFSDPKNGIAYLKWLGRTLGFKKLEDWYNLTWEMLIAHRGGVLFHTAGSVPSVVRLLYPGHEINEWQFTHCPSHFWNVAAHRRRYMRWLGDKLGFRAMPDWYKIKAEHFQENGGAGLLYAYYGNSPSLAVKKTFPKETWHEWLFGSAPNRFWSRKANCRRFLNWLGEQMGYRRPADWYSIKVEDFYRFNGRGFLSQFGCSPSRAISTVYSECTWDIKLFYSRPQQFWKDPVNRRTFLDDAFRTLKLRKWKDWYSVTNSDFHRLGATGLLRYYEGSHSKAVMDSYPEHNWHEWLFQSTPQRFWQSRPNRERYMKWLGQELRFMTMDDWYSLTGAEFRNNSGDGLLQTAFNASPARAVMETFPHHKWLVWRFACVPQRFWQHKNNRRDYLKWLGKELGFKRKEDWYGITKELVVRNYGGGVLDYCGGSCGLAVSEAFPEHRWDPERFSALRKDQKRIYRIIKRLYCDAIWNYKHPEMRFEESGAKMELDIWIPSVSVGVEYQGQQHFVPVKAWGGVQSFRRLRQRDAEKRAACEAMGIRLVEIPYTWDGKEQTIIQQITAAG